jgi:peptidoglycan/xylan/chitin deacetylase (PgdA/CDA1 family)
MLKLLALASLLTAVSAVFALEPIPDRLVVLTFDDSVASQFTVVRPLLKQYQFGATFFITEGFNFLTDKTNYMTWAQIAQLHAEGFEIGNHTRDHMAVTKKSLPQLREQLEVINDRCNSNGIPTPISFAWPGNTAEPEALATLRAAGIRFARRGGGPEYPYDGGHGFAYEPGIDNPLMIPAAGDGRPQWKLDDFKQAVAQAREGRIAVLQFHGVPDKEHPWVHTPPAVFEQAMKYLRDEKYKVIALKDLARYVDPTAWPANPMAIIEQRKKIVQQSGQNSSAPVK